MQTIFKAIDGKEFLTRAACEKYEKELNEKRKNYRITITASTHVYNATAQELNEFLNDFTLSDLNEYNLDCEEDD